MCSAAATQSGWTAVSPTGFVVWIAMRSFPGSAPTSSQYGRVGGAAGAGSPGHMPQSESMTAAVSRTDRLTQRSTTRNCEISLMSGPMLTRPRVGFSPTRPQHDAGMRIEPPPSFACATGTTPLATAAAEPPDEPPDVRPSCHGLWVGPYATGSVVGTRPSSGVFVRPIGTKPASRYFVARLSVCGDR